MLIPLVLAKGTQCFGVRLSAISSDILKLSCGTDNEQHFASRPFLSLVSLVSLVSVTRHMAALVHPINFTVMRHDGGKQKQMVLCSVPGRIWAAKRPRAWASVLFFYPEVEKEKQNKITDDSSNKLMIATGRDNAHGVFF